MFRINDNWEFIEEFNDAFLRGEGEGIPIRIPHTVKELPLHYADSLAFIAPKNPLLFLFNT